MSLNVITVTLNINGKLYNNNIVPAGSKQK